MFKKAHNFKILSVLLSIVFLCNTTLYSCPASKETLRVPVGTTATQVRIEQVMEATYHRHNEDSSAPGAPDRVIRDYAERQEIHALSEFEELETELEDTMRLSGAVDTLRRLLDVLLNRAGGDEGQIQFIFVESEDDLPVFEGEVVYAHPGSRAITVFIVTDQRPEDYFRDENNRRETIAIICREMMLRSTRARERFEAMVAERELSEDEVASEENVAWALKELEDDADAIRNEISVYGRIRPIAPLYNEFAGLHFDKNVSPLLRGFTKGEADSAQKKRKRSRPRKRKSKQEKKTPSQPLSIVSGAKPSAKFLAGLDRRILSSPLERRYFSEKIWFASNEVTNIQSAFFTRYNNAIEQMRLVLCEMLQREIPPEETLVQVRLLAQKNPEFANRIEKYASEANYIHLIHTFVETLYLIEFADRVVGPERREEFLRAGAFDERCLDRFIDVFEIDDPTERVTRILSIFMDGEGGSDRFREASDSLRQFSRGSVREDVLLEAARYVLYEWKQLDPMANRDSRVNEETLEQRWLRSLIDGNIDGKDRARLDSLPLDRDVAPLTESIGKVTVLPTTECTNDCLHCLLALKEDREGDIRGWINDVLPYAEGKSLLIVGGEPTRELSDVEYILGQARGVEALTITTNASWARNLSSTRKMLRRLKTAARGSLFVINLSMDKYHQEVIRTSDGSLKERIPVDRIANIIQLTQQEPEFRDVHVALSGLLVGFEFTASYLFDELERRGLRPISSDRKEDKRYKRFVKLYREDGTETEYMLYASDILVFPNGIGCSVYANFDGISIEGNAVGLEGFEIMWGRAKHSIRALLRNEQEENLTFKDIHITITRDGEVYIDPAFLSRSWSVGNVSNEPLDTILERVNRDPLARALATNLYDVIEIAREVEPDLDERLVGFNSVNGAMAYAIRTPSMRRYIRSRFIQEGRCLAGRLNRTHLETWGIDPDLPGPDMIERLQNEYRANKASELRRRDAYSAAHHTEHFESLPSDHALKEHEGPQTVMSQGAPLTDTKYIIAYCDENYTPVQINGHGIQLAGNIRETGLTEREIEEMLKRIIREAERRGLTLSLAAPLRIVAADRLPGAALGGDCVGNTLVLLNKGLKKIEDKKARRIMAEAVLRHEILRHEFTGLGDDAHTEENDRDDVRYIVERVIDEHDNPLDFIEAIRDTLEGTSLYSLVSRDIFIAILGEYALERDDTTVVNEVFRLLRERYPDMEAELLERAVIIYLDRAEALLETSPGLDILNGPVFTLVTNASALRMRLDGLGALTPDIDERFQRVFSAFNQQRRAAGMLVSDAGERTAGAFFRIMPHYLIAGDELVYQELDAVLQPGQRSLHIGSSSTVLPLFDAFKGLAVDVVDPDEESLDVCRDIGESVGLRSRFHRGKRMPDIVEEERWQANTFNYISFLNVFSDPDVKSEITEEEKYRIINQILDLIAVDGTIFVTGNVNPPPDSDEDLFDDTEEILLREAERRGIILQPVAEGLNTDFAPLKERYFGENGTIYRVTQKHGKVRSGHRLAEEFTMPQELRDYTAVLFTAWREGGLAKALEEMDISLGELRNERGTRCLIFEGTKNGRKVAIKIDKGPKSVQPGNTAYANDMQKAIETWRKAGLLGHRQRSIVKILDAGTIDVDVKGTAMGLHYQILEFLEGEELDNCIRNKFFNDVGLVNTLGALIEFTQGFVWLRDKGLARSDFRLCNFMVVQEGPYGIRIKQVDLDGIDLKPVDGNLVFNVIRTVLLSLDYEPGTAEEVETFIAKWEDQIWEKQSIISLDILLEDLSGFRTQSISLIAQPDAAAQESGEAEEEEGLVIDESTKTVFLEAINYLTERQRRMLLQNRKFQDLLLFLWTAASDKAGQTPYKGHLEDSSYLGKIGYLGYGLNDDENKIVKDILENSRMCQILGVQEFYHGDSMYGPWAYISAMLFRRLKIAGHWLVNEGLQKESRYCKKYKFKERLERNLLQLRVVMPILEEIEGIEEGDGSIKKILERLLKLGPKNSMVFTGFILGYPLQSIDAYIHQDGTEPLIVEPFAESQRWSEFHGLPGGDLEQVMRNHWVPELNKARAVLLTTLARGEAVQVLNQALQHRDDVAVTRESLAQEEDTKNPRYMRNLAVARFGKKRFTVGEYYDAWHEENAGATMALSTAYKDKDKALTEGWIEEAGKIGGSMSYRVTDKGIRTAEEFFAGQTADFALGYCGRDVFTAREYYDFWFSEHANILTQEKITVRLDNAVRLGYLRRVDNGYRVATDLEKKQAIITRLNERTTFFEDHTSMYPAVFDGRELAVTEADLETLPDNVIPVILVDVPGNNREVLDPLIAHFRNRAVIINVNDVLSTPSYNYLQRFFEEAYEDGTVFGEGHPDLEALRKHLDNV